MRQGRATCQALRAIFMTKDKVLYQERGTSIVFQASSVTITALEGGCHPFRKHFTTEVMELVLLTGGDIYPTPVHIMAIKHFRHFTRPY
jgi:hypothetical protein